jgi:hypothetical protein
VHLTSADEKGDDMKPQTDMNAPFDRTSTREELFQVIELLSGAGSSAAAQSNTVLAAIGNFEQASTEENPAHGADLWAEATSDEELALASEIAPLADLFLGKRQRIN